MLGHRVEFRNTPAAAVSTCFSAVQQALQMSNSRCADEWRRWYYITFSYLRGDTGRFQCTSQKESGYLKIPFVISLLRKSSFCFSVLWKSLMRLESLLLHRREKRVKKGHLTPFLFFCSNIQFSNPIAAPVNVPAMFPCTLLTPCILFKVHV